MSSELAISPGDGGRVRSRHTHWNLLRCYLRPRLARVAILGTLLLAVTVLQLLKPQVVRVFIDHTQAGRASAHLSWLAAAFLLLAVSERAASLTATHSGTWLGWDAANELRSDLARHCLGLPMSYHATHSPGELVERLDGDVLALGSFLSELFLRLAANVLLAVATVGVMLVEDVRVGLGFAAYAILTWAALSLVSQHARGAWARSRAARARQTAISEELLTLREDLVPNGGTQFGLDRLAGAVRENLAGWRGAALMGAWTSGANRLLQTVGLTTGLGLASWLYLRGETSIGTAYLIASYMALLAGPLDAVRRQVSELQSASAATARVWELLDQPGAEQLAGKVSRLPDGPLGVELRDVGFHYGVDSHAALDGVNLTVNAGQTLGLAGRTGSGKTTLARLLLGLYKPTSGEILVGGRRLDEIGLGELRRRVGLVTQDVQLVRGSVRDNVTLYDPATDDETILSLLQRLGLGRWLGSLPNGLDTQLATGTGLSAGEAQLLSIARLLLRNPGLVVLDEASATLDEATGHLVERALAELLPGRTVVVIAHRLSTMESVDCLAVLASGRVLEQGAPQRLARRPDSAYAALRAAGGWEEALPS